MITPPRRYRDAADLHRMQALLQAGCAERAALTYYAHPGDLNWWLFNWLDGRNPWQGIYLWDDPADSGQLLGWGLYAPWGSFDVFVQPRLCASDAALGINAWMEERAVELARAQGHACLQRTNAAETDAHLCHHLRTSGFRHVPVDMLAMQRALDGRLPRPDLPEGFSLRPAEDADAAHRAAAQHAAFRSSASLEEYQQGYIHFAASPGYPHGSDWIVLTPHAEAAAFCIAWPDSASRVGQIEPVGVHPAYQRQGLGRAVLLAGLRHLQIMGMQVARICVLADNLAAIRLYEWAGFRTVNRLWLHQKELDDSS